MSEFPYILAFTLFLGLLFSFTNGSRDSGNTMTALVSERIVSPHKAVILCASMNLLGALLGIEVALTIAKGLVQMEVISNCPALAFSALVGAVACHVITRFLKLPTSSFHGLIGGIFGAAVACGGWEALNYEVICRKVLLPILFTPLGGFAVSFLLTALLVRICLQNHPRTCDHFFYKAQVFSSGLMALSHGMNDAQKAMGIIVLALFSLNQVSFVEVPFWVRMVCALAMFMGTIYGGLRVIRSGSYRIFEMQPLQGFVSTLSSSVVTFFFSLLGVPISTTHVFASTVVGVGSSRRLAAARSGIMRKILIVWFLTIPAAALMSALVLLAIKMIR